MQVMLTVMVTMKLRSSSKWLMLTVMLRRLPVMTLQLMITQPLPPLQQQ
jgi:hypothetical protein